MSKIYDKEFSILVKNSYIKLLYDGVDEDRITSILEYDFLNKLEDNEKVSEFWMALAAVQYYYGRLEEKVLNKALRCIQNELVVIEETLEYGERYKDIISLKNELATPPPQKQSLGKRKRFCCQWEIGDVYAFPLQNEEHVPKQLDGKYFLFHKVDEMFWHPDHICPIVRVKICDSIPQTKEEIDKLEYVQIFFTKYEDRFLPINRAIPTSKQISEKEKIEYVRDGFGQLPEYRIAIVATSRKEVPNSLIYVGNFKNLTPPENEFVPHTKLSIPCTSWKNIKNRLIDKYLHYKTRKTGDGGLS